MSPEKGGLGLGMSPEYGGLDRCTSPEYVGLEDSEESSEEPSSLSGADRAESVPERVVSGTWSLLGGANTHASSTINI